MVKTPCQIISSGFESHSHGDSVMLAPVARHRVLSAAQASELRLAFLASVLCCPIGNTAPAIVLTHTTRAHGCGFGATGR